MKPLLETLTSWIIENDLAIEEGNDIFRDVVPDSPDQIISLLEYNSKPSRNIYNSAAVRYVQVVARDTQSSDSKKKADQLYSLFSSSEDGILEFSDSRWVIMLPLQLPFKLREDAKRRIFYGFNVAITTNSD